MASTRLAAGLVGLPNVGKSTLFNALSQAQIAAASNFPFCTIEPNISKVLVPDPRLETLASIAKSREIIHRTIEFHDIAGLVKGASEGQGLGNKFLANIRETSAIIHVLRCFEDTKITHVSQKDNGETDPVEDLQVIETELLLADLASVEKRLEKMRSKKLKKDEQKEQLHALEQAYTLLSEGKPARSNCDNEIGIENLGLLSSKPVLYACNISESSLKEGKAENEYTRAVDEFLKSQGRSPSVKICSTVEEEASTFFETPEERQEYLADYGLTETGLSKVVVQVSKLMNLDVFYTVGPQEARSWPIISGCIASEAAGKIHTDMERGFIAADTISYEDYVQFNGEKGAKENGKYRVEGRDYMVQSGDIMNFKFNV